MSKFEKDLSKGSIGKQLWLFSVPFIISNLIQALYSVADMIIVGQFSGMVSMSGVNIGGQITLVLTNLSIGFSVGATVLIAQYLGAGKRKEMHETIGTLFSSLFVLALVITVAMLLLRDPVLRLINTPEEAYGEASRYLQITMLGNIFIFGYNALGAIMRGMGDSKNPMIFVTVACAINVVLDLIMVGVMGMGASGAAIATVISQAISMLLCIVFLRKNNFIFSFSMESFKIHKQRLKMLLKIGIPTAVQNAVAGLSFLFLTAIANSLGVAASAAVGAVGKFNGFAIMPAIAISSAISAMSAQNIGAGEMKRAIQTLKIGVLMAYAFAAVVFSLAYFFPTEILSVFANDAEMFEMGRQYLKSFSYDYLIVPVVFCLNGLFIGSGHTLFSMINGMISSVLVRIPASYLLGITLEKGMLGIGIAAPAASGIALILGALFFLSGRWKRIVIKH